MSTVHGVTVNALAYNFYLVCFCCFFFFKQKTAYEIAGDPVLYGNLPPREISMKDVFRSGDSSKKFKIAEGQWYRYAPSYVSPAYHLLEGFPFIQEPPSGDLQERVLIRHH